MLSQTTCRAFVALIFGALTLAATAAAARTDTSAQQALDALNRIRSENGIPAGITLNADWSAKCAAHDRYMQENNVLTHPEDPSKPGYSDGGNWAGTHAILSEGGGWGPDSTPWDTAPIHLAQMLAPELAETGIANVGAYSCLTTWPGYERTGPSDVIYTSPATAAPTSPHPSRPTSFPSSPVSSSAFPPGLRQARTSTSSPTGRGRPTGSTSPGLPPPPSLAPPDRWTSARSTTPTPTSPAISRPVAAW